MPVLSPFRTTTLKEAVHGELVVFTEDRGGELAVKCGSDDFQYVYLAVFRSSESKSPYLTKVTGDAECISYGVSWLIEVDQLSTFPSSADVAEKSGSIHVSKDGICMRVAGDVRAGFHGGWLDLAENKPTRAPQDAYATIKWRLWLDAKDRDNPNAKPILVFPPAE